MGCTSSKRIEDSVVVDPYRPSPASFSIFDVYAIEEPWLSAPETDINHESNKKPSHVPAPILEKLNAIEDAPRTWDEVSKVLEDLKPKLKPTLPKIPQTPPPVVVPRAAPLRRKSFSFHTLEELEARAKTEAKLELDKSKTLKAAADWRNGVVTSDVPSSLNDNMFIVRDKFERGRERKPSPPGGAGTVHGAPHEFMGQRRH